MADKTEEEIRRLGLEMRLLENSAQAIQSRSNMVNAVISDLAIAEMTLTGLGRNQTGSELLVPVGGSSYIRATLQDPDKVIVGIGAGVSVEKTLDEAKAIIARRLQDLEKTKLSLEQRLAELAEKIGKDQARFEELAEELRKR